MSQKEILILHNLVCDDYNGSITPPLRVGSWWSSGGEGVMSPEAASEVMLWEGPSCPSSPPGCGTSHPWRIRTCQEGKRYTARSRRTRQATFSVPADAFFISCRREGWWLRNGGLQIWSAAPANWPENARQLRLMSLPTQINARPQRVNSAINTEEQSLSNYLIYSFCDQCKWTRRM